MNDLSVVVPVYRENEKVVTELYRQLTKLGCEVLIVDDGNSMDLPFECYSYPSQVGYGYAIKHGIKHATRPIILTLDGDFQHQVKDVTILYNIFKSRDDITMVIGNRWNIKDSPTRWFFRKCINFMASIISGHYQPDLNSGMRIFKRDIAISYQNILCDTFSFTTSLTMAITTDKYKIVYFPIDVLPRANGKSHVKLLRDGFITIYYITWIGFALRTRKLRAFLRRFFHV